MEGERDERPSEGVVETRCDPSDATAGWDRVEDDGCEPASPSLVESEGEPASNVTSVWTRGGVNEVLVVLSTDSVERESCTS
jgi:hypothetical protein